MTDIMLSGLPKWPQMLVTGKKVTTEQALEIIRRTDSFFVWGGGNNHAFNAQVQEILEMPKLPDRRDERFEKSDGTFDDDAYFSAIDAYHFKRAAWLENWEHIDLEYISPSWISCSFIGGPHGFVWPTGDIFYDDNIGKYPSCSEVYEEWLMVAQAFPFLEINVTLMDKEGCEEGANPVISFRIKNGAVSVVDPSTENVHEGDIVPGKKRLSVEERFTRKDVENAIPLDVIKTWKK